MSGTALQGNLSTFSLQDVLEFVDEKKHTGVLEIAQDHETMQVYFERGKVVCFSGLLDGSKIGRLLYRRGIIGKSQYESLSGLQNDTFCSALGTTVELTDAVAKEQLVDCLRIQEIEETVALFSLTEGNFKFSLQETKFPGLLRRNVAIPEFLEKGKQLRAHWKQIQTALPNQDLFPRIPDLDKVELEKMDPKVDLWTTLAVVDGRRSVSELARISPWGRFATLSGLAQFVQKRFLSLSEEPLAGPFRPSLKRPIEKTHEGGGGFLASFMAKESDSGYRPRTKVGLVAELLGEFLEGLKARKEFSLQQDFLKSSWRNVLIAFPSADLVDVLNDCVDVSHLEGLLEFHKLFSLFLPLKIL